jgi:hypothetical protein
MHIKFNLHLSYFVNGLSNSFCDNDTMREENQGLCSKKAFNLLAFSSIS